MKSEFCEEWLSIMPVGEERFEADSVEEMFDNESLIKALRHRINDMIQEVGMEL